MHSRDQVSIPGGQVYHSVLLTRGPLDCSHTGERDDTAQTLDLPVLQPGHKWAQGGARWGEGFVCPHDSLRAQT